MRCGAYKFTRKPDGAVLSMDKIKQITLVDMAARYAAKEARIQRVRDTPAGFTAGVFLCKVR